MSTKLKKNTLLFITIVSLWGVACVYTWQGSTSSGGNRNQEVIEAVIEVGKANNLSKTCLLSIARFADASVRAKIAKYRPTARLLKENENKAIQNYKDYNCPPKAIAGMSYGISKIARDDYNSRSL